MKKEVERAQLRPGILTALIGGAALVLVGVVALVHPLPVSHAREVEVYSPGPSMCPIGQVVLAIDSTGVPVCNWPPTPRDTSDDEVTMTIYDIAPGVVVCSVPIGYCLTGRQLMQCEDHAGVKRKLFLADECLTEYHVNALGDGR